MAASGHVGAIQEAIDTRPPSRESRSAFISLLTFKISACRCRHEPSCLRGPRGETEWIPGLLWTDIDCVSFDIPDASHVLAPRAGQPLSFCSKGASSHTLISHFRLLMHHTLDWLPDKAVQTSRS